MQIKFYEEMDRVVYISRLIPFTPYYRPSHPHSPLPILLPFSVFLSPGSYLSLPVHHPTALSWTLFIWLLRNMIAADFV